MSGASGESASTRSSGSETKAEGLTSGFAASRRVLAACGGRTRGLIRRAYGPQLSREPR